MQPHLSIRKVPHEQYLQTLSLSVLNNLHGNLILVQNLSRFSAVHFWGAETIQKTYGNARDLILCR
jgi:hypothetical protein